MGTPKYSPHNCSRMNTQPRDSIREPSGPRLTLLLRGHPAPTHTLPVTESTHPCCGDIGGGETQRAGRHPVLQAAGERGSLSPPPKHSTSEREYASICGCRDCVHESADLSGGHYRGQRKSTAERDSREEGLDEGPWLSEPSTCPCARPGQTRDGEVKAGKARVQGQPWLHREHETRLDNVTLLKSQLIQQDPSASVPRSLSPSLLQGWA